MSGTFARRIPLAAGRSAGDDHDSPSAFLPASPTCTGKLMPVFLAVSEHGAGEAGSHRPEPRARAGRAAARCAGSSSMPIASDALAQHGATSLDGALPQEARHLSGQGRENRRAGAADLLGSAEHPDLAEHAADAARLCKADLATDMVRELTELQGTMGGIYAREQSRPEEVWKAIYFHYLPVAVEATASPTREQLGSAAMTWAARLSRGQAGHRSSACSRLANGPLDPATRTVSDEQLRGSFESSSTCPN